MLDDIKTPDRAEKWMMDALAEKAKIMGFGHRVYKKGDSRVPIMREIARDLGKRMGKEHGFRFAKSWKQRWSARNISAPTSISMPRRYLPCWDFPPELNTPIFAVSRVAGWCAHVVEQHDNNRSDSSALALQRAAERPYPAAHLRTQSRCEAGLLRNCLTDLQSLQERYAPGNACLGCGPANPDGLHIRSFPRARVVAEWKPEQKYEAFPGVLNGGIIGTLLDCHCNWTAACHLMKKTGQDRALHCDR